jgi:hypothetical protein
MGFLGGGGGGSSGPRPVYLEARRQGLLNDKLPNITTSVTGQSTNPTTGTPYKMNLGELANYQALQIRRLFEGPKSPNYQPRV